MIMTPAMMMDQLKLIGNDIYESIFDEEPTARQLLMLATSMSFFWAVVFYILTSVIGFLIRNEPKWLIAAADRDYERNGREMAETFGMDSSPEGCRRQFIMVWPWLQVVCVQHAIGGLLCVPSLLNLLPHNESLASSLACLGIISEMGWEMQDLLTWIIKRYFTEHGKERVSLPWLTLIIAHHSLTTCLAVPLIVNYRHLKTLHWICFDLQFAACICLSAAEYSKLLDVENPSQLRRFQQLSILSLVVSVWSRIVHWLYLIGEFVVVWYKDQAYGFLGSGLLLGALFTLFSYLCVVEPQYKRWRKFRAKKAEYEEILSNDQASPAQHRSSFLALNVAADALLFEMEDEAEARFSELAEQFFPSKSKQCIARRASVPASLRLTQNERRRSSVWKLLQRQITGPNASTRRVTLEGGTLSSLVCEFLKKDQ